MIGTSSQRSEETPAQQGSPSCLPPTETPQLARSTDAEGDEAITMRVVACHQELLELKPQWDELYSASGVKQPFLTFEWVDAWWRQMLPRSPLQKHRLNLLVICRDGQLCAVAPMLLTTYLGVLLGGLRYLRPIGSDKNLTELRCLLIRPGFEAVAVRCFADYIEKQRHRYDLVRWLNLPKSEADTIGLAMPESLEEFILPLSGSWTEMRAGLKRNIKESIRKCYNSPARAGIELRFEAIADRREIRRLLPDFWALHAKRSQSHRGPVHLDYFARRQHREFLETLVQSLETAPPVLFVIRHHDRIVAARLGFRANSTLYLYFSGFDPDYGEHSVMTRLLVEAVQHACDSGLAAINFSTGRDTSKLRWGPQSVVYVSRLQWSKTPRARLLGMIFGLLGQRRALGQSDSSDTTDPP